MDVAAAPPPDLVATTAPLGRAPPGAARPLGQRDPGGSPTVAPFDLLLQLLASALPSGQSLPAGGSDLPAAAEPSSGAVPPAGAPSAIPAAQLAPSAGPPQGSTDLASWLRLAFAGAAAPQTSLSADPAAPSATPLSAAGPANAPTSTSAAADPAHASTDAAPIDLQALLGTASAPETPTPELAALVNASRERAAADASRRAGPSVAPVDGNAPTAATDSMNAAANALHAADLPPPVAVTEAITKAARLDDALPLVVTPAAGADQGSAPALPLMQPGHATATSAASAQTAPLQSTGDSIDTTAARWHDALATRIQWLVDHDVGEAKIRLNPPELGALDVKIALQDDKTYVQMTAHSASARDELAQGLPRLRELLSAGGLELGGATVSGGGDGRASYGSAAPQPISRVPQFAAAAEALPDIPSARRGASAAVIDTFA
jgi:flagellar hook-length control protein FliK